MIISPVFSSVISSKPISSACSITWSCVTSPTLTFCSLLTSDFVSRTNASNVIPSGNFNLKLCSISAIFSSATANCLASYPNNRMNFDSLNAKMSFPAIRTWLSGVILRPASALNGWNESPLYIHAVAPFSTCDCGNIFATKNGSTPGRLNRATIPFTFLNSWSPSRNTSKLSSP